MFSIQPKDKPILDLLEEEYLGNTEDRNEIRQGFTDLLGDMMFTIPAIQTANAHRGNREWEKHPPFVKPQRTHMRLLLIIITSLLLFDTFLDALWVFYFLILYYYYINFLIFL